MRISVTYTGGLDIDKGRRVEELAAEHGGTRIGSGYFFADSERDIEIEFEGKKDLFELEVKLSDLMCEMREL